VRTLRLTRAREDLTHSDWPISDTSHFSRSFKAHYGSSPLAYRNAFRHDGQPPDKRCNGQVQAAAGSHEQWSHNGLGREVNRLMAVAHDSTRNPRRRSPNSSAGPLTGCLRPREVSSIHAIGTGARQGRGTPRKALEELGGEHRGSVQKRWAATRLVCWTTRSLITYKHIKSSAQPQGAEGEAARGACRVHRCHRVAHVRGPVMLEESRIEARVQMRPSSSGARSGTSWCAAGFTPHPNAR
jgi:hypothetical protein